MYTCVCYNYTKAPGGGSLTSRASVTSVPYVIIIVILLFQAAESLTLRANVISTLFVVITSIILYLCSRRRKVRPYT